MGLDITAYRKCQLIDNVELDECGEPCEYDAHAWVNPSFEERSTDIKDGYYTAEDSHVFRAGSYSGYGAWRDQLAQMAGYPCKDNQFGHNYSQGAFDTTSGDFWELINFSDCECTIGTEVSKKLHDDFVRNDAKAAEIGGYFYEKYQDWKMAFEFASDSGFVRFW
ncbi:MAG: hypothetical protein ACRC8W_19845 [Plesiomonas shigelloides]